MIAPITAAMKSRLFAELETIEHGRLTLKTPEGATHVFGSSAPDADIEIHDWAMLSLLVSRGDIGLGEAYVDGMWDTSSIEALTTLGMLNLDALSSFSKPNVANRLKFWMLNRLLRVNSRRGAARNIRAHYDVGNEFYQLWLDDSMTYSSAIYSVENENLEDAQARKYDRILDRMPDRERLLEIGCGWGGFAERAAVEGRHVTGLTISPSQKGYADARLDGRADIRLQDYRDVGGRFDGIVSIEMIEAVGERFWPVYFDVLKQRLSEGGLAMIQAITVPDSVFETYRKTSDFIRHYTFPGGMLPCEAAISQHARHAGLEMRDTFSFGPDYARTCREWGKRLQEVRDKVVGLGYGEQFLRSWEYYLAGCAASFEIGKVDVVQIELAHARA